MRYGANGMPMVEKKKPEAPKQPAPQPVVQQPAPQPVVQQPAPQPVVQQPAPQPVVQQPAPQPVVQPVNVVHNVVEEGNVPANNE